MQLPAHERGRRRETVEDPAPGTRVADGREDEDDDNGAPIFGANAGPPPPWDGAGVTLLRTT